MFVSGTGAAAPITPHLRAKSRLRRLRSETRLRAQSRGEGAPSAHTGGGSGMREETMEEVR